MGAAAKTRILKYLRDHSGASHLASFSLVAGHAWTGRGGGGDLEGVERMVHRELVGSLAPLLPELVDQVIVPDGDDLLLVRLTHLLYSGR
jgi:hypothetical protein